MYVLRDNPDILSACFLLESHLQELATPVYESCSFHNMATKYSSAVDAKLHVV